MQSRIKLGSALLAAAGSLWVGYVSSAQAAAPAIPFPDDVPKPPYKSLPEGPVTLNPGVGADYFNWTDMYDSAIAAPEVHHVRFQNEHVRLVEVGYFPGVRGRMHGHAFSSVFAIDGPTPRSTNARLNGQEPVRWGEQPGPNGQAYPICRSQAPQDPHAETNLDTYPHHFLRLEFKRVDGTRLADHWREWYPRLTAPVQPVSDPKGVRGAAMTSSWPYAQAYDSVVAAPNTNRLLWEDSHARLIEVAIRPGETEVMHGNPYTTVLAFDSPPPENLPVRYLERSSPLNTHDFVKTPVPQGTRMPVCAISGPQAPRALTNNTKSLIHYYRIELKRVDGEDLRTRWAEFYPWLAAYKKAWDAKPYAFNY